MSHIRDMGEHERYEATGCAPSCTFKKFHADIAIYDAKPPDTPDSQVTPPLFIHAAENISILHACLITDHDTIWLYQWRVQSC